MINLKNLLLKLRFLLYLLIIFWNLYNITSIDRLDSSILLQSFVVFVFF